MPSSELSSLLISSIVPIRQLGQLGPTGSPMNREEYKLLFLEAKWYIYTLLQKQFKIGREGEAVVLLYHIYLNDKQSCLYGLKIKTLNLFR